MKGRTVMKGKSKHDQIPQRKHQVVKVPVSRLGLAVALSGQQ